MVAYSDLGGLGSKQGAPVVYNWVMPSLMPQVLPWLLILALLMLKPNRCAPAWWIWIPLACVGGLTCTPQSLWEQVPSAQFELLLELVSALGFGLAAVWLLSSYLGWIHRILAFLGMSLMLGVFSALAYFIRQSWEGMGVETLGFGVFLGVGILVVALALTLAGLVCRGQYSCVRLSLWLITALVAAWFLIIGPCFIIGMLSSGANVSVKELLLFVAVVSGITFGVLLPFLVLSFANGFYRGRLQGLLHLGGAPPPPVIDVPPPAVPEAAPS